MQFGGNPTVLIRRHNSGFWTAIPWLKPESFLAAEVPHHQGSPPERARNHLTSCRPMPSPQKPHKKKKKKVI